MFRLLKKFQSRENGAVALEALIMTPLLAFMFIASFVFFDAFRIYNTSIKATYAVADVMSRQRSDIYDSDVYGMGFIFQHISRNPGGSDIRISQVSYDSDTDTHFVDWSEGTGARTELRNSDLPGLLDQIPIMADGDAVIIVESWVPYQPAFNVGLNPVEFTNFTTTRPRWFPLNLNPGNDPACVTCNWGEGYGVISEDGDIDTDPDPTGS